MTSRPTFIPDHVERQDGVRGKVTDTAGDGIVVVWADAEPGDEPSFCIPAGDGWVDPDTDDACVAA